MVKRIVSRTYDITVVYVMFTFFVDILAKL